MTALFAIMLIGTSTLQAQNALPTETGALMSGSGICQTCHDSNGSIMMEDGQNISPPELWRSSMMANSARDPLWRAKVREEMIRTPHLASVIEDKCTRCHTPMGHVEALHAGAESYTFEEAINDPLAADGVSCTLCHQISPAADGSAETFSGHYPIEPNRVIYGPYESPFTNPMQMEANYTAAYGSHMGESEICATCHTLFTPYVDNDGEVAGTFAEQTPYLEWKNSIYSEPETEMHCQACHMPVTAAAQDISSMPPWHTTLRSPFYIHEFVGGNAWMLGILGDNVEELELTASSAQFERSQGLARQSLAAAVELEMLPVADGDSLQLELLVRNMTGHKLPTGIPLRRMWLSVLVKDLAGDTLFQSGLAPNGHLPLPLDGLEPHHQVIRAGDGQQIYEAAMGDVDGARTFTLLRAGQYLKDNRIPPIGFTTEHSSYDSTVVAGQALLDEDFGRENGQWGSGQDKVYYRLALPADSFQVEAALLFQSVMPEVIDAMDDLDDPHVSQFRLLAAEAGNLPEVMAQLSWLGKLNEDTGLIQNEQPLAWELGSPWPNPFNPATQIPLNLSSPAEVEASVYDLAGHLLGEVASGQFAAGQHQLRWMPGKLSAGIYLVEVRVGDQLQRVKVTYLK